MLFIMHTVGKKNIQENSLVTLQNFKNQCPETHTKFSCNDKCINRVEVGYKHL
uniref:Uncharacterized protein n=1 Tax=Anguilla anguilla TaxID=7936 RepID=A0A0E9XXJ2_ANGAN